MNLEIAKGKFVCIIGDVGSGKSSLLSALIGDMLYLKQDQVNNIDLENINEESQSRLECNESPIVLN